MRYDSHGHLQLLRSFNSPTGLGTRDKIFLVVEQLGAPASVQLNNQPLGQLAASGDPLRAEISGCLQSRNLICIATKASQESSQASGLTPNVRLEIESSQGDS